MIRSGTPEKWRPSVIVTDRDGSSHIHRIRARAYRARVYAIRPICENPSQCVTLNPGQVFQHRRSLGPMNLTKRSHAERRWLEMVIVRDHAGTVPPAHAAELMEAPMMTPMTTSPRWRCPGCEVTLHLAGPAPTCGRCGRIMDPDPRPVDGGEEDV